MFLFFGRLVGCFVLFLVWCSFCFWSAVLFVSDRVVGLGVVFCFMVGWVGRVGVALATGALALAHQYSNRASLREGGSPVCVRNAGGHEKNSVGFVCSAKKFYLGS